MEPLNLPFGLAHLDPRLGRAEEHFLDVLMNGSWVKLQSIPGFGSWYDKHSEQFWGLQNFWWFEDRSGLVVRMNPKRTGVSVYFPSALALDEDRTTAIETMHLAMGRFFEKLAVIVDESPF